MVGNCVDDDVGEGCKGHGCNVSKIIQFSSFPKLFFAQHSTYTALSLQGWLSQVDHNFHLHNHHHYLDH